MVFIDDSPVGNDEQDTATNTESEDNLSPLMVWKTVLFPYYCLIV